MTLILAFGNRDCVIQLSDRRLVSSSGPIDEESNKAGLLVCDDARLVFGFSGLAEIGGTFKTRHWILDTLYECCDRGFRAATILSAFQKRATQDFQILPILTRLGPGQKALSIIFSGYLYTRNPPMAVCSIISNCIDFTNGSSKTRPTGQFEAIAWNERRPLDEEFTFIQRIGWWPAMTLQDERLLRKFLSERKPPNALIEIGINLIRSIADRPEARNVIGKQLSVACLRPDKEVGIQTSYHTDRASYRAYYPDSIFLTTQGRRINRDVVLEGDPSSTAHPLAVPKVRRNFPCPCGSGEKYKYCHGKRSFPAKNEQHRQQ